MDRAGSGNERGVDLGRDDYWAALAAGDRAGALDVVRRLRDAGRSHLELIEELVVPAQERVGELWSAGEWSIEQEQVATSINEGLVHWLSSFAPTSETSPGVVVVGSVDGHELPALVLSEQLRAAGTATVLVGGSDEQELLTTVLRQRPRALLLSASLTSSLARLKPLLAHFRAAGVPVVVGGRAFGGDAARAAALGATAYAADVAGALELLDRLPPRLPTGAPEPPTPADVEAAWLQRYADEIAPYVVRALAARHPGEPRPPWWPELDGHVRHLLGCLAASLVTGDETIMVEVRDWLGRVLGARGASAGVVAELWDLLAAPLRGHPLARLHLAGSVPVGRVGDGGGRADDLAAPA